MKNKFYFFVAITVAFFGSMNAQVAPTTPDFVARPTTSCPTPGGTFFPGQPTYYPSSTPQLGVNNTGTDICQEWSTGATSSKTFQVMTWDNVTSTTPFASTVYVSFTFNDVALTNSFSYPGGYDPDVAIWSDSQGTFVELVFENSVTNDIDGYTFYYNTTTLQFVLYNAQKSIMRMDNTKIAKNPNVAATKDKGRFAVVWHEEGLVTPPQTLTVTYNTSPVQTYTNTISMKESKVYIYCIDKPGYLGDLLGSPAGPIINNPGRLVIRNTPPGTNNLFDRNYNPDVSIGEDLSGSGTNPNQVIISVAFLSEYFNPAIFQIVSDGLSVVQGTMDDYRLYSAGVNTQTHNFTRAYSGKPRIAARLSGSAAPKDFSVVMGNANTPPVCNAPSVTTSQLHQWWFQTGVGAIACPAGGVNLFTATPLYGSNVTSTDPVISCVHYKGQYAIAFTTNNNNSTNRFDIVANTYSQGSLVSAGAFSMVNFGTCLASVNAAGNQVIPSIASVRKIGSGTTLNDKAYSNYLFWDHVSKTMDYKKTINNIPGGGLAIRQMQGQTSVENDQTEFKAYPNPANHEISFDFKLAENEIASEIEIFNMLGQSVDKFSIEQGTSTERRDVGKIQTGTYIAILKTNIENHKLEFIKK